MTEIKSGCCLSGRLKHIWFTLWESEACVACCILSSQRLDWRAQACSPIL